MKKIRKKTMGFCLALFMLLGILKIYLMVPGNVYLEYGDTLKLKGPFVVSSVEDEIDVFGQNMETDKKRCSLFGVIPIKTIQCNFVDREYVNISGQPIGIYVKTKGILVVHTDKVETKQGETEPVKNQILAGDYIVQIDGEDIDKKEELVSKIQNSNGSKLEVVLDRDGQKITQWVQPVQNTDGKQMLGIWVRDDMAGIGTMTYVDQKGEFGALGHPISDLDCKKMVVLEEGSIYLTDIVGMVKGEKDSPGELTGIIDYNEKNKTGELKANKEQGIFGNINDHGKECYCRDLLPIAFKQEITTGDACIWSTFDGTLQKYQIQIDKVLYYSLEKNKGIMFHVTDEKLLEKTGGILQGMSGSPIVQNGKVVGAVTHVFVDDPTKGYGIFIEEMVEK